MSSEVAIAVRDLSKCHHIYSNPKHRLMQLLAQGRKKYYKEFWAVRDVSFEIGRGETVGLIGRNGSGKSTLLQMICGTVTPTSGSVETRGRVAALLELGAGFNSEFTGRENVLLNAAILGFPKEEIEKRMEDVLAFSELGDYLDQPVKTYSSGMYSRLAFSIAINVDPDILIVDEALAVGDARFVAKCMRRIKDIQSAGATILFVSHDVGSVRTLCSRALWLNKGVLVDQGAVFPVTGRFMEFMFSDDADMPALLAKDEDVAGEASAEATTIPADGNEVLDSRPATRWGSNQGIIVSAGVFNKASERKSLHVWGEEITVCINVKLPSDIDRQHLCISFSIKDLKGTDLIVSTTRDLKNLPLPNEDEFSVRFSFQNPLVTGKYLLVAAVENRQNNDIHYYEYIEGAHYFSSTAEARFFGLVQPQISQQILVEK